MNNMRRVLTAFVVAVVAFVSGGAAQAATQAWGPRTKSWNGAIRVESSGAAWNDAGTAKSKVVTKDRKADGNDVHGGTIFYIK